MCVFINHYRRKREHFFFSYRTEVKAWGFEFTSTSGLLGTLWRVFPLCLCVCGGGWGGIFEPVKANKTAACEMRLPEELSSSLFYYLSFILYNFHHLIWAPPCALHCYQHMSDCWSLCGCCCCQHYKCPGDTWGIWHRGGVCDAFMKTNSSWWFLSFSVFCAAKHQRRQTLAWTSPG